MAFTEKLFEEPSDTVVSDADAHVVGVVVNTNVWRSFDYIWPDALDAPALGQRVYVPFGRGGRKLLGFVTDTLRRAGDRKLKSVLEVLDAQPQLDEPLLKLGQWISQYYLTPPGMTLAAMIPSAVGRHRSRSETVVRMEGSRGDWPSSLGARQKRVLDELFEARRQGVEELPLGDLLRHSGASRDSVKRLAGRGLIRMDSRPVRLAELSDETAADPFELNADQLSAMAKLKEKLGAGFSATLLHGVTGSGKTEVYVRVIREVIAAGRQAILLVPEIALATQTLERLLKRLPRVAVLHSGLTDAQRSFHYEQIRDGHAAVVVGPRSAVFAPARKLGLIVVDEEHESSYKQDTAPRYHGRDVAVKRAQIEGVPIVLGSATPSLESFRNAGQGRYELIRLPHRVRNLPMPRLTIVDLRKELTSAEHRIELIGKTLTNRIASTLDRNEQVILLMNRRGYASYVFSPSSKWVMMCPECSRPMVYHQATALAMCHHCDRTETLPERCPVTGGKLVLFGFGIQRIENELSRKFPGAIVARMDSDTMTSTKQFHRVLGDFGEGKVDILLGTQMVGKGLDFPRVSLVGIVSADTSLAIPDFRSSERTFQLIVQVAGRAGRADIPGEVIVQTIHEKDPAIQFASRHDYDGFAAYEMPLRKEIHLPPFTRLVRFVVRHADQQRAENGAAALAKRLREMLPDGLAVIIGPQPAGVIRLRGQFRHEVRLRTSRGGLVQQFLAPRMEELSRGIPAEILADVDPTSLM